MEINTEFYEGPLDLLLSFVEKENESIYSVNICTIIDQYLVAINGKDLSLDDMSSFALMAARLLEIKSRMLLPPEEDEDPAEELRDELAEHQLFKEASKQLLGMYEQHSGSVVRTSTVEKIVSDKRPKRSLAQEVLKDLTLNDLSLVCSFLLNKQKEREGDCKRRRVDITKEVFNYEEVAHRVASYIAKVGECRFRDVPYAAKPNEGRIAAFLSLLSLTSQGEISITQDQVGEDIYIKELRRNSKTLKEIDNT